MLFDPTIFDNLKVAFENELYDLDNLDRRISIIDRKDTMELSVMGREFRLRFHLTDQPQVSAEVCLRASLPDLAAEILQQPDAAPGCSLSIFFYMTIADEKEQCKQIEDTLSDIWEPAASPRQTLSYTYGEEDPAIRNMVELAFKRQINEEQMHDISDLAEHMLQSLERLAGIVEIHN